jgi:hypothetical protein
MKMREGINQERACRNAYHAERDCYHVSPPCLVVPGPNEFTVTRSAIYEMVH